MSAAANAVKVQKKEKASEPADNDFGEFEAMQSAGAAAGLPRFMQGDGPRVSRRVVNGALIQRECSCGGTCAACQSAGLGDQWPFIRRKGGAEAAEVDASVIPSAASGRALPRDTQRFLESRMGVELQDVRVHTDGSATDSARALQADAYTVGRDIYFGADKYHPDTTEGMRLISHEVAHTLQQGEGRAPVAPALHGRLQVGAANDPAESEADAVAERVMNGSAPASVTPVPVTSGHAPAVQRDVGGALSSAWDATGGAAWSAAKKGAGRALDAAGHAVGAAGHWVAGAASSAAEFVADQAMSILRAVAPGLASIIDEGPIAFVKRKVTEALDAHMPDALGGFSLHELIDGVSGWIGKAAGFIKGLAKGDAQSCAAFASFMQGLTDFVSSLIDNPVVGAMMDAFSKAADFVGKVLKVVLAPAFEALSGLVRGAWTTIKSVAGTISGWIKSAKAAIGRAWDWLMGKLGFDDASEGGVWSWIKGIAGRIWDSIKTALAPIAGPLRKIGTVLYLLTPMGQIHAIVKYGPKLVKVAQWIWENGLSAAKIREAPAEIRDMLHGLADGVDGFKSLLSTGFDWLSTLLSELGNALLEAVGAITGLPLLGFAKGLLKDAQLAAQRLVASIQKAATDALHSIQGVAAKVIAFIKPYKEVLSSLVLAIASPPMIPLILAGWAWRALPRCVKIPILNFVLDIAIKEISAIPELPIFGLLWPLLKPGLLAFLGTVRKADDGTKEKVSNKIAKVVSGASPEFLIAFVKGFAVGIWEGITDPIKAIWSVLEGLDAATEYLASLAGVGGEKGGEAGGQGASMPTPVVAMPQAPGPSRAVKSATPVPADQVPELRRRAAAMADSIGPDVDTVKHGFWDAVHEYFSGPKMTLDDLIDKLAGAWKAAKAKISEGGAWLANQLIGFFKSDGAESELGDKIGWLAGSVGFQILLDVITAGTAEAVTASGRILGMIVKFINWPMEVMGEAFKLLSKLGKYLLDILKGLGGAIKEAAGGAFKAVSRALGNIGERLIAFGEEILAKFGGKAAKVEEEGAALLGREGTKAAEQGAARDLQDLESGGMGVKSTEEALGGEIEDAGIVGESALAGHEIKVTESGMLVRCSNQCQLLGQRYKVVLDANKDLEKKLIALQKRAKTMSKSELSAAAQELENEILDTAVRDAIRATGRDIKDVEGAMQAIRENPEQLEKLFDINATRTKEALKATGEEMLDAASHTSGVPTELRDRLRSQATTPGLRADVNTGFTPGMKDPALPGKVVLRPLEADHLFALKRIIAESGFGELTYEEMLYIVRYEGNFAGLSKAANASKGAKSFAEWMEHKASGIKVDPAFRREMFRREYNAENEIVALIEWISQYGIP
jgi:hypothetical protein